MRRQVAAREIQRHRDAADKVAERLGVHVAGNEPIQFWVTPLLEALVSRIESLESELANIRDPDSAVKRPSLNEGVA